MTTNDNLQRLAEALDAYGTYADPTRRMAEELRDRGGQDMLVSPEAVLALLDRVAAAEIRAKQADDLDTRNQRLTGDWKDALERAEKAEADAAWLLQFHNDSANRAAAQIAELQNENAALRATAKDTTETLLALAAHVDGSGTNPRFLGRTPVWVAAYIRKIAQPDSPDDPFDPLRTSVRRSVGDKVRAALDTDA